MTETTRAIKVLIRPGPDGALGQNHSKPTNQPALTPSCKDHAGSSDFLWPFQLCSSSLIAKFLYLGTTNTSVGHSVVAEGCPVCSEPHLWPDPRRDSQKCLDVAKYPPDPGKEAAKLSQAEKLRLKVIHDTYKYNRIAIVA